MSRRTAPRLQRASAVDSDVFHRQFTFWLAALFLFVLAFWLLAFGYLFGFVGFLVAVPLAATIGVQSRFALRRYLQSSFYTGENSD